MMAPPVAQSRAWMAVAPPGAVRITQITNKTVADVMIVAGGPQPSECGV